MCELNWGFNEWCTITTIFLSVVAIIIAIWSSHSTSKDAEKQIREIKNLSALQIETSIKQLEVEIQKIMAKVKNSTKESEEINKINDGAFHLGPDFRNAMMQKHQETKALRDLQIYRECSQNLNEILKGLKDLKNK
jgi:methyl coenzyme M reductase subunit D